MTRAEWGYIRQLPSGNYQASYAWEGERHTAPATFPTRRSAGAWLAKERARLLAGDEPVGKRRAQAETLGKLFSQYLVQLERNGASPATVRSYVSRWNCHLKPVFNHVMVGRLSEQLIVDWEQRTQWKSAHVRRNALLTLSAFLKWLADTGRTRESVMPRRLGGYRAPRRREPVVLTGEQVALIRQHMPERLAVIVDLAAWCALRFGEIAALRRCDVDTEAGVVHVRAAVKRGVGGVQSRGSVKSRAGLRTVAIPPACLQRVKAHMDRYVQPGARALVVHMAGQPDQWLTNKSMHYSFDPACRQAGVAGVRFHDLRHTGLTMAARKGATLAELMYRAGHSDVESVMIYQHANFTRDQQLAHLLEG